VPLGLQRPPHRGAFDVSAAWAKVTSRRKSSSVADRADRPRSTWRQDLAATFFAGWMVLGMILDGRAHKLGILGESFFSIWHSILYSGFLILSAWVVWLNMTGLRRLEVSSMPIGYGLAVLGLLLFFISALADMIWHSIFGFEQDMESGLSPPHLALFVSGMLLITGPFRAAWATGSTSEGPTILTLTPALLTVGLASAGVISFSNALLTPLPWSKPEGRLMEVLGIYPPLVMYLDLLLFTKILVANFFLVGMTVLLLKRWMLPFGSFTLIYFLVAALNVLEDDFKIFWAGAALATAGLGADVIVRLVEPEPARRERFWLAATVIPMVTWSLVFAVVAATYGLRWSPELWSGTILFAALCGFCVAFVAVPPRAAAEDSPPWRSPTGADTLPYTGHDQVLRSQRLMAGIGRSRQESFAEKGGSQNP
jgi:hypothetical protein